MISDRCDFSEFVRQAQGQNYEDIIYLADREATEAERRFYHHGTVDKEKLICGQDYAQCLKAFISYMRYGIKSAHISGDISVLFEHVRDNLPSRSRPFRTHH
jgi:hypothetical protein